VSTVQYTSVLHCSLNFECLRLGYGFLSIILVLEKCNLGPWKVLEFCTLSLLRTLTLVLGLFMLSFYYSAFHGLVMNIKISSEVKFQVTVWVVFYCCDYPLFGRMMRAWLSTYSTCVNFSWISTNLTSRLSPQHLHGACASWFFYHPRQWCLVRQRVVSVHWKVSSLASEPAVLYLIVWV